MKLMIKIHNLAQTSDAVFETHKIGVSARQAMVIYAISELNDPCQKEICLHTSIDRSTMTPLVRSLLKKKLIQRKRGALDERMWVYKLTVDGQDMTTLIKDAAIKTERELFRMIEEDKNFINTKMRI